MSANADPEDLAYVSEIPFGAYAAAVAPLILWMVLSYAHFGTWYPTPSDRAWAIYSQAALTDQAAPLDDTTVVSLSRTTCFGWCPAYTLRIYGSGRVEYFGSTYVCAYGKQTATADPREVRRLVEALIASGFFGYQWQHGGYATDNPSVTSGLRHDGQSSSIWHYHGDAGAPPWLRLMEDEIDRVAGTARWLPTSSQTIRGRLVCPDGTLIDDSSPGSPPIDL